MATRKDVAEKAGVSVATVSYVMNDSKNVTPEVKKRVEDAIKELDYYPNLVARSLATKQTRHVAMLVDNLKNPYYCDILDGAQSVASQHGYIVSVISTDVSNRKSVLELAGRGVDGIILALGSQNLDTYLAVNLPKVYVGSYITIDYKPAIYDMVKYLKDCGHNRLGFLSGISIRDPGHLRYRHLMEACREYGMYIDESLVVDAEFSGRTDERAGRDAMNRLLSRGVDFTAVFTVNDLMAMGARKAICDSGLRIPEDVSLIGCDNIELTNWLTPQLATIDAQAFMVGCHLMRSLKEEIEKGPIVPHVITAEFKNKGSIGEVKAGK